MRMHFKHNYRKQTREFVLNDNEDGRKGAKSFAGSWHIWRSIVDGSKHGQFALHFVPRSEPDRPCVLLIDPEDVPEIKRLCDEFLAAMESAD